MDKNVNHDSANNGVENTNADNDTGENANPKTEDLSGQSTDVDVLKQEVEKLRLEAEKAKLEAEKAQRDRERSDRLNAKTKQENQKLKEQMESTLTEDEKLQRERAAIAEERRQVNVDKAHAAAEKHLAGLEIPESRLESLLGYFVTENVDTTVATALEIKELILEDRANNEKILYEKWKKQTPRSPVSDSSTEENDPFMQGFKSRK